MSRNQQHLWAPLPFGVHYGINCLRRTLLLVMMSSCIELRSLFSWAVDTESSASMKVLIKDPKGVVLSVLL